LRFSIVESPSTTSKTRQFDLTITTGDQTPIARISQLAVQRVANPNLVLEVAAAAPPIMAASHFDDAATAPISGSAANDSDADAYNSCIANSCNSDCFNPTEDPLLVRLRHRLSAIIECDEAEINVDTPLENLGFDSMMAIEMLDALEKDFGVKIPTDQFWSGLTLGGLLQRVHQSASGAADASEEVVQWVEGTL
jgi:acyl carrier protein